MYEGIDCVYSFIAEIGTKYEFQVRAVNRIGASSLSSSQIVYISPPTPVKEIVEAIHYINFRPK